MFENQLFTHSLMGFKDILVGTDADLFDRVKNRGINMMEVFSPTYIYRHEIEDSITYRLIAGLWFFKNFIYNVNFICQIEIHLGYTIG